MQYCHVPLDLDGRRFTLVYVVTTPRNEWTIGALSEHTGEEISTILCRGTISITCPTNYWKPVLCRHSRPTILSDRPQVHIKGMPIRMNFSVTHPVVQQQRRAAAQKQKKPAGRYIPPSQRGGRDRWEVTAERWCQTGFENEGASGWQQDSKKFPVYTGRLFQIGPSSPIKTANQIGSQA
jgi:hypothetical protein